MAVIRTALGVSLVALLVFGALAWKQGAGYASPVPPATDPEVLDESIAFFQARLTADPWNLPVAGRLIDRYMLRFQLGADMADVRMATEIAGDLVGRASDRPGAHARLSAVLLAQHDFSGAVDAAEQALATVPNPEDAVLGAAFDAWFAVGRYEDAQRVLAGMDAHSTDALLRRARWAEFEGLHDAALGALDEVCARIARSGSSGQTYAWCQTEMAKLAYTSRGESRAVGYLKDALAVQPGYRGAVEGLADFAAERGDAEEALERYREIATDAHPDLYLRISEALEALGRSDEAVGWRAEFMRVAGDPAVEQLYAPELARYLAMHEGRLDEALEIARREVQRRPTVESRELLAELEGA